MYAPLATTGVLANLVHPRHGATGPIALGVGLWPAATSMANTSVGLVFSERRMTLDRACASLSALGLPNERILAGDGEAAARLDKQLAAALRGTIAVTGDLQALDALLDGRILVSMGVNLLEGPVALSVACGLIDASRPAADQQFVHAPAHLPLLTMGELAERLVDQHGSVSAYGTDQRATERVKFECRDLVLKARASQRDLGAFMLEPRVQRATGRT